MRGGVYRPLNGVVTMGTFLIGALSGLMIAGCAAIYAKQALIEEARSHTDGYF
ncbi:hypothetical protein SAMN02799642_00324 [Methylobacterium brachiatum]|nr:hypothetical protein SAMN02799642_00324 [Methylobacterium brachiatum]